MAAAPSPFLPPYQTVNSFTFSINSLHLPPRLQSSLDCFQTIANGGRNSFVLVAIFMIKFLPTLCGKENRKESNNESNRFRNVALTQLQRPTCCAPAMHVRACPRAYALPMSVCPASQLIPVVPFPFLPASFIISCTIDSVLFPPAFHPRTQCAFNNVAFFWPLSRLIFHHSAV